MTRRLTRLLAALAVLASATGLLALATPANADVERRTDVNDFSFESFDAQYYLSQDDAGHATLRTVETLVALFPDYDQNHGLLRSIPEWYGGFNQYDPARVETHPHVTAVTMNGKPHAFDTSDDNGFLDVAIRSNSFVHGRTTYVIDYTQQYVARTFADADEFYWDVNGTGWAQSFDRVSADIHLSPALLAKATGQNACYFGYQDSPDPCTGIQKIHDGVTATQEKVGAGQNLTLAIGFPLGTFTPGPRVQDSPIVTVLPWVLLGILALIVVLIVILRVFRWRHAPGRGTVVPQYEGPVGLGVLPAAAFLGVPKRGLPAEFVNLAVTGIARLIEDPSKPESKRFRLDLLDRRLITDPDDDTAVRKLFGKAGADSLVLDRDNRKLGDRIASLVSQADAVLTERKLVEKKTSKITKWLRWPAFACFALAWFIVVWAGNENIDSGWLTLALIVIIPGSLVVIGFGGVPERRTELGSETREHLEGLRMYLQLAEADRLRVLQSPEGAQRTRVDPNDPAQVVKLYERLLPWAMVWGIEDQWGKVLGEQYATTQVEPTNLQFTSGLAGLSGFATSAVASSFTQTVTSSSGGSSGSSSSFGGSFGGGFSGGGGGGGGGGGL